MYSHGRHFNDLSEELLKNWQEEKIEESRTLDFKKYPYVLDSKADAPRRDIAADICGFANAGGGLILLGVDEERDESGGHGSRFGEIVGVDLPDGFPKYQNQVEEIVRQAIEPRGVAVRLKEIPIERKPPVIVIGIEPSTRLPHRLRAYSSTDFWIRTMRTVEKMDVDQIREAFRRTFTVLREAEARLEDAEERTRNFPSQQGLPVFGCDHSGLPGTVLLSSP